MSRTMTSRIVTILLLGAMASALPLWAAVITPSPYWKNEIDFPEDPFRNSGDLTEQTAWIKFTIFTDDPTTVYFQDSVNYEFHYDFATEVLDPFAGMSFTEFNQRTLYAENQQAVLGAVIIGPKFKGSIGMTLPPSEYGIQFVGLDPYPKETIRDLFNAVKAGVNAAQDVTAFYFPSFEQADVAGEDSDWFESEGIIVSSTARWEEGNTCYSEGWALGDLKYVPGDEIEDAYRSGILDPGDILLTDGVPAEIPFVEGIISLSPVTPNSHVVILAKTYNVPFVYLADADDAEQAQSMVGQRIALRARIESDKAEVRLINAEEMGEQQADELLALKIPAALEIQAMEPYGAYSASTDILTIPDIKYFGGKAAHYGLLRTVLPDNSPKAAAFSFDLWNAYLDQTVDGAKTFREEIASRLQAFTYPPANMAFLADTLDDIRDMFRDTDETVFSNELEDAVINTLTDPQYGFDSAKKLRVRSSTNVEDSEEFTGAGLYDSYSGCLQDDLDGDDTGPSICDQEEADERGVFRAIRKVFASFYNDNAYLERLRYGVNENDVGMALLVTHSFPDEIELANGVATFEMGNIGSVHDYVTMVSQVGAVSVTNPETNAIPEEVEDSVSTREGSTINPRLLRPSSLVTLGDTVLEWNDEYVALITMFKAVAYEFGAVIGETYYMLEFEYKKVGPDGALVVKQVRRVPQQSQERGSIPFLINMPVEYVVYQGESRSVFANHRLKSEWFLETKNMWLSEQGLNQTLYGRVRMESAHGGRLFVHEDDMENWPEASHSYAGEMFADTWVFKDLPNARSHELSFPAPDLLVPEQNPLLLLSDYRRLTLAVTYERPVVNLVWDYIQDQMAFREEMITEEEAHLRERPQPREDDIHVTRTHEGEDGVSITTSFYWPAIPTGDGAAGYTAPLVRWDKTVIEGLTSQAIILDDYYSQTYRPLHHNFMAEFLFEPRLEPGISWQTLNELYARDIRLIHLHYYPGPSIAFTEVRTFGFEQGDGVPGDINRDETVNAVDVQLVINEVLGLDTGRNCDVNLSGGTDASDVQLVINAALGIFD